MLEIALIGCGVFLLLLGRQLWLTGEGRIGLWGTIERAYLPGVPIDHLPGEGVLVSLRGRLDERSPHTFSLQAEDGIRVDVRVPSDVELPRRRSQVVVFGPARQAPGVGGYRDSGLIWLVEAQVIVEANLIPRALKLARALQGIAAVISGTGGAVLGFAVCSLLAALYL